jgi:RNA polymerase sigma-70 factor (ECF subfamily)
MTHTSTDEANMSRLLRAALGGDQAAYAEFLQVASGLVRSVVKKRLREDGAIATEDVVQEVLLALHAKRHTWRATEPVLPWVFGITRYKVIDVYRRRGRRIQVDIDDFSDLLPTPEPVRSDPSPGKLEAALAVLTPTQRSVVESIAVHGASVRTTAGQLGMKETAVRVAFHRGLNTIAKLVGRDT